MIILIRSLEDPSLPGVSLDQAMLQVIALEVHPGSALLADSTRRIRWTAYLYSDFPRSVADSSISFIKLIRSPNPLRVKDVTTAPDNTKDDGIDANIQSKSIESITIIVGTSDGNTLLWDINSDNGASAILRDDGSDIGCRETSSAVCQIASAAHPFDATVVPAIYRIHALSEGGVGPVTAVVSNPDGHSFSLVLYM